MIVRTTPVQMTCSTTVLTRNNVSVVLLQPLVRDDGDANVVVKMGWIGFGFSEERCAAKA
ncbi:hypothetical protein Taro_054739 [Colocasia esculenta]|uniref:Uncharacterized protein n=1 Tax=Colocasia esculenta TaxID=4460 RepID=A0A843XPH9_COLES|nr:hypothetical protein [Colocasia esculenta]